MPDTNGPSVSAAYLSALALQLQQEAQAPAPEAALFCSWLQFKPVAAAQLVYTPGVRINYIYLVQQGLFRLFRIHPDGREQTLSFHTEGDWMMDMYAFIEGQPTQLHLQALESGSLLAVNRTFINRALQQFTWYKHWQQQQMGRQLSALQQHLAQLRTGGPYHRYQHLMAEPAALMRRIPSALLANYLGITVEELEKFKG